MTSAEVIIEASPPVIQPRVSGLGLSPPAGTSSMTGSEGGSGVNGVRGRSRSVRDDRLLAQYMQVRRLGCQACPFECTSPDELLHHVKRNHLPPGEPGVHAKSLTTPPGRGQSTPSEVRANGLPWPKAPKSGPLGVTRHALRSPGAKIRCSYPNCSYRFAEEELKIHSACHTTPGLETHDPGQTPAFRCCKCEWTGLKWRKCAMHLWANHGIDIDLLSCSVCQKFKTVYPAQLENHHETVHGPRKILSSSSGVQTFAAVSPPGNPGPTQHLRPEARNSVSEPYPEIKKKKQCDICSKYFSDSKSLKKHVQAVHSKLKPYICQICNHQSARKTMLEMHMRQHTGEKPYSCEECPFRTGDHNSLRRHKMRHTGQRPYKCPLCEYSCIQSSPFKQHIERKHPEEGQSAVYYCNACQFKSVNRDLYFDHIQSHTKDATKSTSERVQSSSLSSWVPHKGTRKLNEKVTIVRVQNSKKRSAAHHKHSSLRRSQDGKPINASRQSEMDIDESHALVEDDDSLHATHDLGGTTIPA
eukprot:maker-scaffold1406_size42870-snap-gene-0.16 protein:Tk07897 transcript:maker-scaffold1406_size42870-snap-gene-0.16-mRNA-1 annotation:"hypothetical protein L798_10673"